jgi:HNH endonuclease
VSPPGCRSAPVEWQQASFTVYHAKRTPNLGVKHIGAFKNERMATSLDNVDGICQFTALFREGLDASTYLLRLAGALAITERPKKASRYISDELETKLVCDSMHLCNICRERGVIIHHIIPIEEGGHSAEENLIVVCLNHHNEAHSNSNLSKKLRPEHLREYKRRHLLWVANRGYGIGLSEIVQ